jgi:phosphomethylpyrimidine synthase
MKISDEVREFAKQKGLDSQEAIEKGMQDKAKEFVDKGSEIYSS